MILSLSIQKQTMHTVPVNLAYEIAVAIKLFLEGKGHEVIGIEQTGGKK